jgi:hypothetical protein
MTEDHLFFRGAEGYEQIIQDERLSRPGRAIRVYNYGRHSGDEDLYIIGTEKKLFDAKTGKMVDPKVVFSREAAPDGWSVENFALELLPEDEIAKIIAAH